MVLWDDGRELPRNAACIEPLDDGYDGRELASWDTCPWRPERESAQKGAM
jgi:hypothetical protein